MEHKAFNKQARKLSHKKGEGLKICNRAIKRLANTLNKACNSYKGKNGAVTAKHRRQVLKAGFKVFG